MTEKQFSVDAARKIMANEIYGRIKTRDGFPVRLLAFDVKGRYPIAGVVQLGDDEYCRQWTKEGKGDRRPNVRTNYYLIIETEGGEA